jgi:ABC-type siderophore export system fused ATPase/permease subunit
VRNLIQILSVLFEWSRGVKHSRGTVLLASTAGIVSGLGSTALIAVINSSLSGGGPSRSRLIWEFVALCALIPMSGFVSQFLLLRLTAYVVYDLRLRLSQQILGAPYRALEKLGSSRLMATINDDIPAVTTAVTALPILFMQFAIMIGCLIYLGRLSWQLLLVMLGYMVIGLATYQLPLIKWVGHFRLMRGEWDSMFRAFRALTEGSKELKLNRERRDSFRTQQLEPSAEGLRRYGLLANTLTVAAANWGQIVFFIFIGVDVDHLQAHGSEYLSQLHLDGKVRIEGDKLSTLELSQGQRKRLALLTAYLEDRPIYVFDEWASDQDPMFKQVFYCKILPELKARGKTVIVITHDDHYFDVADRLVKPDHAGPARSSAPDGDRRARR